MFRWTSTRWVAPFFAREANDKVMGLMIHEKLPSACAYVCAPASAADGNALTKAASPTR